MKKLIAVALLLAATVGLCAQDVDVSKRLEGFDEYMAKVLKDWNGPGIGVGIVVGDKLVFAKGYGYRDYEKKLPFTPGTVCPIASNTKAVHGRWHMVHEPYAISPQPLAMDVSVTVPPWNSWRPRASS